MAAAVAARRPVPSPYRPNRTRERSRRRNRPRRRRPSRHRWPSRSHRTRRHRGPRHRCRHRQRRPSHRPSRSSHRHRTPSRCSGTPVHPCRTSSACWSAGRTAAFPSARSGSSASPRFAARSSSRRAACPAWTGPDTASRVSPALIYPPVSVGSCSKRGPGPRFRRDQGQIKKKQKSGLLLYDYFFLVSIPIEFLSKNKGHQKKGVSPNYHFPVKKNYAIRAWKLYISRKIIFLVNICIICNIFATKHAIWTFF